MEATSKQLLDFPAKPSIIETLLLSGKEPSWKSQQDKRRTEGDLKRPITTPIPTSNVIGKIKDFLGVMAKANEKLELDAKENSRTNYDIEVLNGYEQEYIEMDLLLGVADLHSDEAVAAAETSMDTFHQPLTSTISGCSDTEESDADGNDKDGMAKKPKSNKDNSSLPDDKSNKRPKIVVLD